MRIRPHQTGGMEYDSATINQKQQRYLCQALPRIRNAGHTPKLARRSQLPQLPWATRPTEQWAGSTPVRGTGGVWSQLLSRGAASASQMGSGNRSASLLGLGRGGSWCPGLFRSVSGICRRLFRNTPGYFGVYSKISLFSTFGFRNKRDLWVFPFQHVETRSNNPAPE